MLHCYWPYMSKIFFRSWMQQRPPKISYLSVTDMAKPHVFRIMYESPLKGVEILPVGSCRVSVLDSLQKNDPWDSSLVVILPPVPIVLCWSKPKMGYLWSDHIGETVKRPQFDIDIFRNTQMRNPCLKKDRVRAGESQKYWCTEVPISEFFR